MKQEKILVIEDEPSIRTVICSYLSSHGYLVRSADDGLDGLLIAQQWQPDLLILDLNLPGKSGLEIAQHLRQHSDLYIIMLTARGEEQDRIQGLRLGADDYIVKPFSPRELVARVEAILRRKREVTQKQQPIYSFRHLRLNPNSYSAEVDSTPLSLTTTEFELLWFFVRHAGQVLSREQLLSNVWGEHYAGTDRVVDVYVGQVRRKLEELSGQILIQTVRGIGYKFVDEPTSL